MNYKISISYIGTNFYGYAKQINKRTVQGSLEKILSLIFCEEIKIISSGRTDRYVHAINQVINFHSNQNKNLNFLFFEIKKKLPNDIYLYSINLVEDKFHSRFDVKKKIYMYIVNTKDFNFFEKDFVFQLNQKLDLERINKIKKVFIGEKNFISFSTSTNTNTTRKIFSIKIKSKNGKVYFYILGNGFLKNMVRFIVFKLIEFSLFKITEKEIVNLFDNPKKGSAIDMCPGCGLYLYDVKY